MQTTQRTHIASLLIALAVTLLATPVASAQGTAEVWLNKATEKFKNKGVEIAFHINEEGIHFNGKLLIDGERFLYDADNMKIWYDGTTQWTLQTGNGYNELYINNPTLEEQQTINPYLLLGNYKEQFNITDGGSKTMNGDPTHVVMLKAKGEDQEPANINLYFNSDATLAAIEFTAMDEAVYTIEIRSMRNGLTFPKDTFTYSAEKCRADEVIDMR